MRAKELKIVILIVLLLSIFTTFVRVNSSNFHFGDSAQNYKMLNNTYEYGFPYTDILPSILQTQFIDQVGFIHDDEDYFKKHDFTVKDYDAKKNNTFFFHTYLIIYIFSPLISIISAPILSNFINCFSFFSLLGLSYWLLRKNNIKIVESLLISFSISLYPGWSQSFLSQPFFDTLYRPLSFLIAYFCFYLILNKNTNSKFSISNKENIKSLIFFFLIFILSMSVVEKTSIYNFIFLFTFLFINFLNICNKSKLILSLLIFLSISYFYLLTNFVLINPYYGGSAPKLSADIIIGTFLNFFKNEYMMKQTLYLFIALLPMILIIAFANIKYLLIFLAILSPSIFNSIGGAEKTGFYTHYHALYLGFLFFFYTQSLINLNNKNILINKHSSYISLFVITYYLFVNVTSAGISFGLNKYNYIYHLYELINPKYSYYNEMNEMTENIPMNSKIVLSEKAMPYFYKYNNSNLFPYNLNQSDYLIYDYSEVDGLKIPNQLITFNNESQIKINKILLERVISYGFDYKNPIYDKNNILILRKKNYLYKE